MSADVLLEVEDLAVDYGSGRHRTRAVSGIGFRLERGRTLGLVGESGSGKTTIGRALLGLVPVCEGRIRFEGRDITVDSPRARRGYAHRMRAAFQDPFSSLNPARPIGASLVEGLGLRGPEARAHARRLLEQVALAPDLVERYPARLSGGQRQRVAIARALASNPSLVICDEVVSALDVSVQAQVLNLLRDLQRETGVSYLFISHDLDVVRYMTDDVVVLRQGEVMEAGPTSIVTETPRHPYTQRLLAATPRLVRRVPDPARVADRVALMAPRKEAP